jgi:YbgC/YbaW family acyl-CoA thioester hydrolase
MKYSSFTTRRKVAFSDTDMAGIVHFSNYFRYMEAAEADFFESLGESLIGRSGTRATGWPRVRAHCDFKAPLYFGDTVEIELRVKEIKIRALVFEFRLYRHPAVETEAGSERRLVAKGGFATIHAVLNDDNSMESASLPSTLLEKIEAEESPV